MKNTIPIVFAAGCYGTYLEWVLTTVTTDVAIIPPFNTNGNSHKFNGKHLLNMAGWHKYVQSDTCNQFVRLHPKVYNTESISNNLDILLTDVNKIIYIYPDHKKKLLAINNMFAKVWNDWWSRQLENSVDVNVIYNNWPVSKDTPIDQVPHWIKREFLSSYLMPAWTDMIGEPICTTESILSISISELLYNFEFSMKSIEEFINVPFTKPISVMIPFHNQMLDLQTYINSDALVNQIIAETIAGNNFSWRDQPASLVNESWVQWRFRELGYELACHELDIFPTNSVQLKKLLYKA